MSYARIRRGPMAADAFTQIRNALFRDPRLSLRDKGLFGLISTHRDGWGVTVESLSTCCTDGVSSIKTGLRNLERYGYLQRERERRADGTLGASAFCITDQPETVVPLDGEAESRRPEPEVDFPPEAEPPVVDHSHKKINSKKTSQKKTSPSVPPQRAARVAGAGGGGGGEALPEGEELRRAVEFVDGLPFGGRRPGLKGALVRGVASAFAAGWSAPALRRQLTEETAGVRSLAAVYEHRLRPDQLPDAPAVPARRPRVAEVLAPDGPVSGPNAEWRQGRAAVRGRQAPA